MLQSAGFGEAAGEGFEPGLTDPESGSVRSRQLLAVSKTAYLRRFSERGVARCLPVFLVGWCTNWCSRKMQDSAEMICWLGLSFLKAVSSAALGECSNTLPEQVSTLLDAPRSIGRVLNANRFPATSTRRSW
jgi:hypothetical protein